ncbi:hypothetical protein PSP6_540074 [Paraburkholderia tropica]|nr:hypothetical protein PSP6_540074 [Paraburkholderia tropica]
MRGANWKMKMKCAIPSKADVEIKRNVMLCVGSILLAAACYVLSQVHQIDHRADDLLGTAYWIGLNLSVLAILFFGVRCFLVCLWPAKFAKISGTWNALVTRALEKQYPGTSVTEFGKEGWLVTDIASGKTVTEISGADAAMRELGKEQPRADGFPHRPGTGAKITHLSQFRK